MLHMFTYLNMFYFMFHTHVGSAVVLLSWGQFGRQPAGSVYLWSSLLHKQLILQNGAERLNQLIIVCDDTQRNHWPRRKPDDNKLNRHISWKPIFFTSLQQFNSVTAFNNIFHVLMFNDLTCCHISFICFMFCCWHKDCFYLSLLCSDGKHFKTAAYDYYQLIYRLFYSY